MSSVNESIHSKYIGLILNVFEKQADLVMALNDIEMNAERDGLNYEALETIALGIHGGDFQTYAALLGDINGYVANYALDHPR